MKVCFIIIFQLHGKDKEMLGEEQRWWDISRMTLTKGGNYLVFCNMLLVKNKSRYCLEYD